MKLILLLGLFTVVLSQMAPSLPPRISFTMKAGSNDAEGIFIAMDTHQVNAYLKDGKQESFIFGKVPGAEPQSPEAKYHTLFDLDPSAPQQCKYEAYSLQSPRMEWGFPTSWFTFDTEPKIKIDPQVYLVYKYSLHKGGNPAVTDGVLCDWYASFDFCQGEPCQMVYFKKGTNLPVKSKLWQESRGWHLSTVHYVNSTDGPIEQYLSKIPKDWVNRCYDNNMEFSFMPDHFDEKVSSTIDLTVEIEAPPHLVNGTNVVTGQFVNAVGDGYDCTDCIKINTKTFAFSAVKLSQKVSITMVKPGMQRIRAEIQGGGYENLDTRKTYVTFEIKK
jgi:hypothetical protein